MCASGFYKMSGISASLHDSNILSVCFNFDAVMVWDTADTAAGHRIMRLGLHHAVIYETQQPLGVFPQTEESDHVERYQR